MKATDSDDFGLGALFLFGISFFAVWSRSVFSSARWFILTSASTFDSWTRKSFEGDLEPCRCCRRT